MKECWQFLICMMIWKILLSVQREEKCVCEVTQPTRLESTSKRLSDWVFKGKWKFLIKKNECSMCICRVVIRRHRQLLRISRFQEELKDTLKPSW